MKILKTELTNFPFNNILLQEGREKNAQQLF